MAITKVFAVRDKLYDAVSYAANQEKTTGLGDAIDYAANPDKTEQRIFETALNCDSPATAYAEMVSTKEKYRKTGKVLGYHFIQSFAPGEVSAEQAHDIGVEFARRLFDNRFEVVIGTHLDREHYHNHIVINSVSYIDGKKYRTNKESYYNKIRALSDELCRENGLSVIEPQGHGKRYKEWANEKAGIPSRNALVHNDVLQCMARAYTFNDFVDQMRRKGYAVKVGKHITVKIGETKGIRIDTHYGPDFSTEGIKSQLAAKRNRGTPVIEAPAEQPGDLRPVIDKPPPIFTTPRRRRPVGPPRHLFKLHGFAATYYKFLYLLGRVKRRQASSLAAQTLREDALKFHRYRQQFNYLRRNCLASMEDVEDHHRQIIETIDQLKGERQPLYRERRNAQDDTQAQALTAEITAITARLRQLYKADRICKNIKASAPAVQAAVRQQELAERQKGDKKHERSSASRRDRGIPSV